MRSRRIILATSLLPVLVLAGCIGHADGTPPPVPPAEVERPPTLDTAFLGCVNVALDECRQIGSSAVGRSHVDRPGVVTVVLVELYACPDETASCPPSLTARDAGRVTIELDGQVPLWYWVSGDPIDPTLELETGGCPPMCFELSKAQSAVVSGSGPFPYQLSHCGINHFVDFDNSWWVLVGRADGEDLGGMRNRPGQIRLLSRNLAEYREDNSDGGRGEYVAQLARFPGPKHIWQACA